MQFSVPIRVYVCTNYAKWNICGWNTIVLHSRKPQLGLKFAGLAMSTEALQMSVLLVLSVL